MKDRFMIHVAPAMILFTLTSVFYLYHGRLFLDAGFYLNAACRVWNGDLLYRDFFFVQAPVYPYVYGFFFRLFSPSILLARYISLSWSLIAFSLAVILAYRWGGRRGAVWAAAALATSSMHAYFFVSIKLYALSGCLFIASWTVLLSRFRPIVRFPVAAVLAVLASGTRLTLLPGSMVVLIYILISGRKYPARVRMSAVTAGAATGILLAAPFLIQDYDSVMYFLLKIHTSARSGAYLFGVKNKLLVLAQLTAGYPLAVFAAALGVTALIRKKIHIETGEIPVFVSICAVTAAHLTANWFSPGYQSVLMPLTVALAGGLVGRSIQGQTKSLILIPALAVAAAGYLGHWYRPLWPGKSTVQQHIQEIQQSLSRHIQPGEPVAACNGLFTVGSGVPLADPFGGAPFTYTPRWNRNQCLRFGGLNTDMFLEKIESGYYGGILVQPDSFSLGFPGFFPVPDAEQTAIFSAIRKHYHPVASFANIGNAQRDLTLYVPLPETGDGTR